MNRKKILKLTGLTLLSAVLAASAVLGMYVFHLSQSAKERFGSKKWELPARIYARPTELYTGMELNPEAFEQELELMQYRKKDQIDTAGSYSRTGDTFTLFTRAFRFEDSEEHARKFRVTFQKKRISGIQDVNTGESAGLTRLDPAHIGSFYPTHNQDRLWVKFKDAPPLLIQSVLAIEDQDFYKHHGVRPMAIARAMLANIKAGRTVQGGSTLTQQLVKNLFLTRAQTFRRKFDEAVMALSLELAYEKDQIFEAYINEVYMGQDGERAVHGFGMAASFFFGRSLEDLQPGETAMLVGLLKGPSLYDPRRNPESALTRRNTVLHVMRDRKLIGTDEAENAMKSELGIVAKPASGNSSFPAFMELVKEQLLKEYKEDDLRTEGLRIFTTFEPRIQLAAEKAVSKGLSAIESRKGFPKGELEASLIVTSTAGNEVLALAGGRDAGFEGFNRALKAGRPIGSLIKPAVYLTALQLPERYTLISLLDDLETEVRDSGKVWKPQNYDRVFHGTVPLYAALAHSYNAATVRMGMDVGLDRIFDTVHKLGVDRNFDPYPSALLGTMSMSVMEVAQMYQSFASGGFFTPIRAIHGVFKPDGEALSRYPLTVRENIDPGAVYLLNKALQAVVTEGTAKSLSGILPKNIGAAGKTGTSSDLRDSWFAGFTGNRLAVVWVGRDDNKPCNLTGASGAMQIWGELMASIANAPLHLSKPENVRWVTVAPYRKVQTDPSCPGAISIPFIDGSQPWEMEFCDRRTGNLQPAEPQERKIDQPSIFDLLKDMF
ncbi:MAG: penicillin-binding protein 1B [Desulfococcaceae bacterium]